MGPGAYLLFYRRRSEIPLGGPRFLEIFERYNNQTAADEDMLDSGEGQRLGQGSSLRGSPSASTGADLTLPQGRGLVSGHADGATAAGSSADAELPSYHASLGQAGEPEDDGDVGAQLPWNPSGALRNSIEADGEDEAIGLSDFDNAAPMAGMTSVIGPTSWSFDVLNKAVADTIGADDDDIASDVAQGDNSSTSDDPFADTVDDVLLNEPGSSYTEPSEPQGSFPTYDDPPAPVAQGQEDYMGQIAVEAWEKRVHEVPANLGDDQASDKVAEIHVGDEQMLLEEPRPSPNP